MPTILGAVQYFQSSKENISYRELSSHSFLKMSTHTTRYSILPCSYRLIKKTFSTLEPTSLNYDNAHPVYHIEVSDNQIITTLYIWNTQTDLSKWCQHIRSSTGGAKYWRIPFFKKVEIMAHSHTMPHLKPLRYCSDRSFTYRILLSVYATEFHVKPVSVCS